MLLHHTLEYSAHAHPEKIALVSRGRSYTYAMLLDLVMRLAASLQARGVRRGDRVAVFLENGVEAVVSYYAALKIGAVFMPINPTAKRGKLAYILADASPTCLITDVHLEAVYGEPLAENASVHTCVLVQQSGARTGHRYLSFTECVALETRPSDPGTIDQDLAAIIYTSGSTGEAKGVMLSHRNMCTAQTSVSTYLDLCADDVILCALPLAFDYGLYQILMAFKVGARVVLERSFAYPAKVLEVMAQEKVTVFPGVPTMFSLLIGMESLSRYDLRALRTITNTAAALAESHIRDIRRLFPQARLFSMYGLTECKRVTYLPPEELDRRPTSVGRGMPNQEVYLVDESDRRLPPGSIGQLVIRGSHVMRGYWNKPEETAARLRPGPIPGEQVLYSGDLFRTDEEGFLYFVGRSDDIIKSRGEKVSPKEVENVLYGLEGVHEAAVVGVPDALLGEAVKAFVVLRHGFAYSEKEVIRHCLAHLENVMVPKAVEFVASLPKTDTGKIWKYGLTETARSGVSVAGDSQPEGERAGVMLVRREV